MKTILVADDDKAFRNLMLHMLHKAGYRTVSATNGQDAICELDRQQIDLILLDLNMPCFDGYTFLKTMNTYCLDRKPPVIVLSNSHEKPAVIRAAGLGICDFVLKYEMSMDDLLARIVSRIGEPDAAERSTAADEPAGEAVAPDHAKAE